MGNFRDSPTHELNIPETLCGNSSHIPATASHPEHDSKIVIRKFVNKNCPYFWTCRFRFIPPLSLTETRKICTDSCSSFRLNGLLNAAGPVRLEQSSRPCPQSEIHRSCFQAPAKDISVHMILAHQAHKTVCQRYTNSHIQHVKKTTRQLRKYRQIQISRQWIDDF